MVSFIATQGTLFDLETVLDYGQSILNVAQELTKSLIEERTLRERSHLMSVTRWVTQWRKRANWA
ncbi:MAG: hypothetical protein V7K71_16025 [Nostoc sp.]|uniref:hypothetical protein n=1 Tax=Nostoc sp. TaxID=1180 RepID=UPI002FFA2BFE